MCPSGNYYSGIYCYIAISDYLNSIIKRYSLLMSLNQIDIRQARQYGKSIVKNA